MTGFCNRATQRVALTLLISLVGSACVAEVPTTSSATPGAEAVAATTLGPSPALESPTSSVAPSSTAARPSDSGVAAPLVRLTSDFESIARSLGEPIVDCVGRMDTTWPVFHGCVDWHSAVHAVFALNVLETIAPDPRWTDALSKVFDRRLLAEELAIMTSSDLDRELPYGFAWLLWADIAAYENNRSDLHSLAQVAASRLSDWLEVADDSPAIYAIENDYDNGNWAAVSLYEWATVFSDTDRLAVARTALEAFTSEPLQAEACAAPERREFFSACHMMAFAIGRSQTTTPTAALLDALAADAALTPETTNGAHAAGLNFSRSWGLLAMSEATCDAGLLDEYAVYVMTHFDQPEMWREDYRAYAHWVAQFGVLALYLFSNRVTCDGDL